MSDLLQSPLTVGGIVTVMGTVITKLYLDGKAQSKADSATILQISQARVDDMKQLDISKDGALIEVKTLVRSIYDKLEAKKRR